MAFASSGTEPAQRCREIKIVLLGDSGVGKSSIAQRYVTTRPPARRVDRRVLHVQDDRE